MSKLFEEITIRGITSRNRIMVSPMCQYSSEDGFATDWHLVHLGSRAVGGAGIICSEAAAVSPEGRISYADLGIWKDEHKQKLTQITNFVSQHGAVPAIQLAHAGRKASKNRPWEGNNHLSPGEGGWENFVAPSAIPFHEDDPPPLEMSRDDIDKVIHDFRAAAKRALDSGFRIIEIHAAHGYLIHEFYSPLTNKRTDSYGGSFQSRIRLLLEILEAVQEVWPEDLPVFVRISATDWVDGEPSWTIEDSVQLAQILKDRGVDLIDCSSGGAVPYQQVSWGPGFQTPFAVRIREEVGIMTGAVGFITSPSQAEHILKTEQADMVIMAREFLRNPYFPMEAAADLHFDLQWPEQYERAK
jgi:2,4-dienoyl-CoA reductase-like NADH-dependent reductase (Old Yellow Enzyme family)